MISELLGRKEEEVKRDLSIAVAEGLVIPNAYSEEEISKYKFLHDRVQQAAYILLDSNELLTTHYKIGRLLLKTTNPKQEEALFDIVNHLNFSKSLIIDQRRE